VEPMKPCSICGALPALPATLCDITEKGDEKFSVPLCHACVEFLHRGAEALRRRKANGGRPPGLKPGDGFKESAPATV